jgi:hypothetical protein
VQYFTDGDYHIVERGVNTIRHVLSADYEVPIREIVGSVSNRIQPIFC